MKETAHSPIVSDLRKRLHPFDIHMDTVSSFSLTVKHNG